MSEHLLGPEGIEPVFVGRAPAAAAAPPHDVFLSYSSADRETAEELAHRLRQEGAVPWLDRWNLIPGEPWQPAIEEALRLAQTCAVLVGPGEIGPWQHEEMRVAIDRRVADGGGAFRVIPVLLPGAERPQRSKLPSFLVATTWVEFRRTLDDAEALRRLLCGIRGVEPGPGAGLASDEGRPPYRGLYVFDVEHARFFFGREALTEWLLNSLRPPATGREPNRFLAIVGASGSGKSSLARAGLLTALKRGEIEGSDQWPVAICRPGRDPLEGLAVAVTAAVDSGRGAAAVGELIAALGRDEHALHLTARLALAKAPPERRLVLLVDQFEEVFTLCPDQAVRGAFIANLLHAARVAQGQTLVLLTMRADFYGKCAAHADLAAALSDHQVLVGPMTDDELRRAIERPAQLVGCELEPGLVELLVHDVSEQAGALPLLQHALLELWEKRQGRRLTADAYRSIGGLEGALEGRANAVLAGLADPEREICRRIFLRLTQPGEGTEDTKRRAPLAEVLSAASDGAAVEKIVQTLADARLITTEGVSTPQADAFVEVSHEALIRTWSQLRRWLDADRAGLRTHHRLTEAAEQWSKQNRDKSYLFGGTRLLVTVEWARKNLEALSQVERDFLLFSVVEEGGVADWLPKHDDVAALRQLLAPYLESPDPEERRAGLTVVSWIAAPAADAALRSYLLEVIASDPAEPVRNRAAEALCVRGHARWLLEQPLAAARHAVLRAVAHCRNLPAIGLQVWQAVPRRDRAAVRWSAASQLVRAHLGQFAIVFSITYMAALVTYQVVYNALSAGARLLSSNFIFVEAAINTVELGALGAVCLFLRMRREVDRTALSWRQLLAAAWLPTLMVNALWVAGKLAGSLREVVAGTGLLRFAVAQNADLWASLLITPFILGLWQSPRDARGPSKRALLISLVLGALGAATAIGLQATAPLTNLLARFFLSWALTSSLVFAATRGFWVSLRVAGVTPARTD